MEVNERVQQLDLAEIFIMSVLKLKNDVEMANLFVQARSTCYLGLVYLCTQAWPTCLPRPGLPVYPGLVYLFTQAWIFSRYGNTLQNIHFAWISSFMGSPELGTITMRSALKS